MHQGLPLNIFDIVFWVSWGFGIATAIYSFISPRLRLPEEQGLIPVFEEICSGSVHSAWYRGPLVRHSIYENFVVLKCVGSNAVIPRKSASIEITEDLLGKLVTYKSVEYRLYNLQVRTSSEEIVLEIIGKGA